MKIHPIVISVVCWIISSHASAQTPSGKGQSAGRITVDNINRSFIVYQPASYSPEKKSPVIFLFHGGGATAGSMLNISNGDDFKDISEKENVLLVAPEGIDKSWNDGRQTKSNEQQVDDIKFILHLLEYIKSAYSVDTARIYATGISNGGFMVSRLACEAGYKFAAVAAVAATMGEDIPYHSCTPGFTIPVMYIHGTEDPVVHFNGGQKTIGAEGSYVSHQQVIDKWVSVNKCNPSPVVTTVPNIARLDGTTITKEEYKGVNGADVISYTIHGGGHTWPGGKQYLPRLVIGKVSRDMNGCEVIWNFFKLHTRKPLS